MSGWNREKDNQPHVDTLITEEFGFCILGVAYIFEKVYSFALF